MPSSKAEILARLQQDILPLQGFKPAAARSVADVGLGPIKSAFPGSKFPLGAVHEFCSNGAEAGAATAGFISLIIASLMKDGAATIWISASRSTYPPALKTFGVSPEKIIFIDLKNETDVQWAMEEALKCDGLAAVVAEMSELSFTASRRLQLAVEQSRVTGFVLRRNPRNLTTTACVTRWQITSLPSLGENGMPGVGFPRWNVELLKVRNGKPGSWEVEAVSGRFRHLATLKAIPAQEKRKTG